jgi:hypothetical protein
MNKTAERVNVLTEGNGKNLVHAIINAVTKGYADNIIIDDSLDLIKSNEVSKGVLATCPDTLRLYAKSMAESLLNIADEIQNFEIQEQQMTIKRKTKEEFPKENNNQRFDELQEKEDNKELKTSSVNDIKIEEDWTKSVCDENKIAGTLLVNFNQDMGLYKKGSEITLKTSAIDYLKNKVFFYFKKEYPQIKVALTDDIFKGNLRFVNTKQGTALIDYEIENAFKE